MLIHSNWWSFSALQRAENSSMRRSRAGSLRITGVSVLFSEPKIPQCWWKQRLRNDHYRFSALQRAENSSIPLLSDKFIKHAPFQCSSASRKFLNSVRERSAGRVTTRFSALQRAENSSMEHQYSSKRATARSFSALQRAENSSTPTLAPASIHISDRDDHASSFLSLPGASP